MMHKLFYLFLISLSFIACQSEDEELIDTDIIRNDQSGFEEKDKANAPKFEFATEIFDFGKITQGETVEHTFKFTNVGKSDLIITDVEGSCGCTVPRTWPRKPISPGEGGQIEVEFNSEGKKGVIKKYVSIVANTSPSTRRLVVSGEIVVPTNLK